jgi:N-acetylmuramoyl-L-alanine amidase
MLDVVSRATQRGIGKAVVAVGLLGGAVAGVATALWLTMAGPLATSSSAGALAPLTWDTPPPAGPTVTFPGGEARRFRVVIDPGHGGSNTGCAGVVEGVYEKRFTLALALALAERLRAAGVDVVMTRDDDRYLTLRERVRFANRADADLFVSVHANASPSRAQRGFETWVLAPDALDIDTRAIRAGDGPPRPGLAPEVVAVLDDAERGGALVPALRVAERMQTRLSEVWGQARSRGVRQGNQDVLMGLTMPGVLVEVGFLDHPAEGAELLRHETRTRLADALAAAVQDVRAARDLSASAAPIR